MDSRLNYILVDDDELYRDYTHMQLEHIPQLHCLAICDNALTAREQIILLQPDLLVLDIEMVGLSGMQLVKSLTKVPLVIFITSHINFAVDAFELDAVDYLVKPVSQDRLFRAIDKVRKLMSIEQVSNDLEDFEQEADHFFIKDRNQHVRLNFADVVYIESLGNFVTFFMKNGDKKIALVSLNQLEIQLAHADFVRISRSHIINKNFVTSIENEKIIYLNNVPLSIGKTYVSTVITLILGNSTIKRQK
jgi:DNA-binding LytR/AlgR family response regulator